MLTIKGFDHEENKLVLCGLACIIYENEKSLYYALKYLVDNYDNKALEWGNKASKRHNSGVATWVAGLASWRLKKFKSAASYFERLGSSQNSDEWLVAAGAYWAARAYSKLGNHLKEETMLQLAAKEKYTFYGIIIIVSNHFICRRLL